MHLTTTAGDSVFLDYHPAGFSIRVLPATPPFEAGVIDTFGLGVKFSTLARLHDALSSGAPFATADGKAHVRRVSGGIELRFRGGPAQANWFECTLGPESAAAFEEAIRTHLAGEPRCEPRRSIKIQRNAPCPCGSGRKFKSCCAGAPDQVSLEALQELCSGVNDSEVHHALDFAEVAGKALDKESFWNLLGSALGSAGHHDRAAGAFRRALALHPGDPEAQLNLAVTVGVDSPDQGLRLVRQLPRSVKRRAIIEGNLLLDAERWEEAVPLFELAIAEEPDFDLAYLNLITCLEELGNPNSDYWIERAQSAIPRSPKIAAQWCRLLYRKGRLEELVEARWIDSLQSRTGDWSMQGRSGEEPVLIVECQLWRACGLALLQGSGDALEHVAELLPAFARFANACDPAKALVHAAAKAGESGFLERGWQFLCERCQMSLGPLDFKLAEAAGARDDWPAAVRHAEACLAHVPDHARVLRVYWWALSETDRIDEAIAVAERTLVLKTDFVDAYWEHVYYNLGLLCGMIGDHGRAEFYYRAQLESKHFHPYNGENLVVTLALNGKLEEAAAVLRAWTGDCRLLFDAGSEDAIALERKMSSLSEALSFAASKLGGQTYTLDVVRFMASLPVRIGSSVKVRDRVVSILEVLQSERNSAVEAGLRTELERLAAGDYSAVVARLIAQLPNWDKLARESQRSLLEAEKRFAEGTSLDSAPEVVAFAKAVEIELKQVVFDAFKVAYRSEIHMEMEVKVALTDRYQKVHTLARFIERSPFIELGGMAFALHLTEGKTATELALLRKLRDFVVTRLDLAQILTPAAFADLDQLAKQRNPAAHSASLGHADAELARRRALSLLGILGPAAARARAIRGSGSDHPATSPG